MFLTEENIKALTNHDFSSIYQDLVEVIKTLENTYNSADAKIAQEDIKDLWQKVHINREKLFNRDPLCQLQGGQELVKILRDFRLKNVEVLPKNIITIIENWENTIIPNVELKYYCLSVNNAIKLSKDELEKAQKLYAALIGIQKTVEKHIQYLYTEQEMLQLTQDLANSISQMYDDYKFQDNNNQEAIENYIISIKNSAKVLLWEMNQYQQNPNPKNQTSEKEKFKTIDELWEDWDEKYDEAEMSESLEILIEAIDSRRRKQGGRTLFS
ncbi:MAG TPA: hypothetical protein VK184_23725 [Nostocaceae cyanobacterium]|nr:hypothetical protein [Nostocaceae cyanobacterium]